MTETELILSSALDLDRARLYLGDYKIDERQAALIADIMRQRREGKPLQYILGEAEFFGLNFEVNGAVLIPRPETEILVEAAIDISRGNSLFNILDIGTGCGCIAVGMAKSLQRVSIDATDISAAALTVARKNAASHGVSGRIRFINADIFPVEGLYDMIVSNPPYIAVSDMPGLAPEVKEEPPAALNGGSDGLDFYRRIASGTGRYLKEKGFLIIEIGYGQSGDVKNILRNTRLFDKIQVIKDYSGIERVVVAGRK